MPPYVNIHGRRPGRGLRPWLLIPKVLAVAVYFGGLVTIAVIWRDGNGRHMDKADPCRDALVEQVGLLFGRVVVPALVVAMLLGAALLILHGRVLLRMRWMKAKLVLIAVGVPVMHLFMSNRLGHLRQSASADVWNTSAANHFTFGLYVLLLWSVTIIFLGRHKPRIPGLRWRSTADQR